MDDLDKVLFARGKQILGEAPNKKTGGVIRKLKEAKGIGMALELLEAASRKENPMEYIQGILKAPPVIAQKEQLHDSVAAETVREHYSAWGNGRFFNFMDLLGIKQQLKAGIRLDRDQYEAIKSFKSKGHWPDLDIGQPPPDPLTAEERKRVLEKLHKSGALRVLNKS